MVSLANAVKGMSALQLMRQLGVQYKTAYVLYLKLRDALWQTQRSVLGLDRPGRNGRGLHDPVQAVPEQSGGPPGEDDTAKRPKQCILAMRKRSPHGGGQETRVKVVTEENSEDILDPLSRRRMDSSRAAIWICFLRSRLRSSPASPICSAILRVRATMARDVQVHIGMPPSYDGGMPHFNAGLVRQLHNADRASSPSPSF
jgi:hypothetical protein